MHTHNIGLLDFFSQVLFLTTTDLFIRPIVIPLSRAPPSKNFDNFSTMWTTAATKSQSSKNHETGDSSSDFILYLTPIYYSASICFPFCRL